MEENSIEEDIKILEEMIENANIENMDMNDCFGGEHIEAIEHILSDYKRVLKENEELKDANCLVKRYFKLKDTNTYLQKENEELTISNKEIDKECSRLEEKEVKLINENEHYKDLIHALEIYYDITEEDLEECMKKDR